MGGFSTPLSWDEGKKLLKTVPKHIFTWYAGPCEAPGLLFTKKRVYMEVASSHNTRALPLYLGGPVAGIFEGLKAHPYPRRVLGSGGIMKSQ